MTIFQPLPPRAFKDRVCLTRLAMFLWLFGLATRALAYPPAPHHLVFGMVRDEYGSPITTAGSVVVFETASGATIRTDLIPGLEPGVAYKLEIPMDAGLTLDLYKPTALRPTMSFRIKVVVAGVTYLPIEMSGDLARIGQPSESTRLNLTLGQDSDGDGLPDAWERLINPNIANVSPTADSDGDGLTNMQEYLAGTYAFDPANGFSLNMLQMNAGRPVFRFLGVRGRTYTLLRSTNLKTWEPINFLLSGEGQSAGGRQNFQAENTRIMDIECAQQQPATVIFKLQVK
jgi:hypothetical protein